jgi:uncharacterized protein involved in outer membrane biogenesis
MAYLAPHPSPRPRQAGSTVGGRLARWMLAILAGCIALVAAAFALLLIDASILRAPLTKFLSTKLERTVAINGDLRVVLRNGLRFELDDVVVGNAGWGSRPAMLTVERAVIGLELRPLLSRRIVLPEVAVIKPDILLERNGEGVPN